MSKTQDLSAYKIISKKRDGGKLSAEEIDWMVNGYTKGDIPDYQMASLLMAIFIRGMDTKETVSLTKTMLYSGKVLSFKNRKNIIDKHSTGGIGDKTSFILAPIAAAAGVKVPMIAGRSLGFTGGTVDKAEAIPGFNPELSLDEFTRLLEKNNLVLTGQTGEIAPADKKIYALRDVTATINSVPLITASIMSKKLAEGTGGLVLDIKYGSGAFMEDLQKAQVLARSLMKMAQAFGVHSMAFLTDMSQPLGCAVGHSLEIIECIETLKGNGPADLTRLCLELAGGMIHLAGLASTHPLGVQKAKEMISSGKAMEKFKVMIHAQGGDPSVVEEQEKLPMAAMRLPVLSPSNGHIKDFLNAEIGFLLTKLGGGRKEATDKIDHGVGFVFHKKRGDLVKKNEILATIYYNSNQVLLAQEVAEKLRKEVILISSRKLAPPPLIAKRMTLWGRHAR